MTEKALPYDAAESLTSPAAVEYFLNDAFETCDTPYIVSAIGIAARAKGMSQVASDTGLAREALYRSFSEDGNPSLKSTRAVLHALGFALVVRPLSETETHEEPQAAE